MQTFLPYPDFQESAACLDVKRLGKQRVEVLQLVLGQFPNHPASRMWRGYEQSLINYGLTVCQEWTRRGYSDSVSGKLALHKDYSAQPPWFGNEEFHASHRSNLLRKDPVWYSRFSWSESSDLPYIWPSIK